MLASLTEGASLREVAVLLEDLIRMTPRPLTFVLAGLAGADISVDADDLYDRPLDEDRFEDSRLVPGGLNRVTCRTGQLVLPIPTGLASADLAGLADLAETTPAGLADRGLVVAETELAWIEQRVPYDACRELKQGTEPAGKILARYGMHRDDRQALTVWPWEGRTAVRSSAVLMLGDEPVAIAYERVTAAFCGLLRLRAVSEPHRIA